MGMTYTLVCIEKKLMLELGKYCRDPNRGTVRIGGTKYFAGTPRPGFQHMAEQEVLRCIERFLILTYGCSTKLVNENELDEIKEMHGEFTALMYPEEFPPTDPDFLT